MAWIEIHQTLPRHRKTLATAGRLSVDRHTIVGHLVELWTWALDNVPSDGFMGDITNQEIAIAADWRGDYESFTEALIHAGYIDKNSEGLWLHDWYEYAGKLLEKREKEKERSKKRRSTEIRPKVDQRSTDKKPQKVARHRTVPNRTVPKELKDEEEYARAREDHSASDPQDAFDIPDAPVEEEPSALGAMWRECDTIFPLRFNSIQIAKIEAYVTDDGMEPALIVETLRDARLLGKGLDYALGILRNKYAEGIRTLDEYKMSQEIFQAQKAAKTNETRAAPNANRNADALLRSMQKMGVTIPSTGGT